MECCDNHQVHDGPLLYINKNYSIGGRCDVQAITKQPIVMLLTSIFAFSWLLNYQGDSTSVRMIHLTDLRTIDRDQ